MLPSIFGENLFDEWLAFPSERSLFGEHDPLYGKHGRHLMRTDVRETEDAYELDVDLPGFKKDEIHARLENGYLTITAARRMEKDETDKKGRYIRRERYAGQCSRSFYVGEGVTQDEIRAKYTDGILRLSLPKRPASPPESHRYIAIEE